MGNITSKTLNTLTLRYSVTYSCRRTNYLTAYANFVKLKIDGRNSEHFFRSLDLCIMKYKSYNIFIIFITGKNTENNIIDQNLLA